MWDRAYLNRLRKELPDWIEKGWVTPAGEAAIIGNAEARAAQGIHVIPMALAVIGALTLGAGVILFFAANWDEMPKVVKLIVLFGSMWIAYAIAGRGLSGSARASRVIAHAMLLLGVILFGANIHLIAQIYHIDAHYPNGVLMWSLGALALVWLVPSQPAAVAGIALATLWSGMEIVDFSQRIHWPFLIVWGLFLPPALYRGWKWVASGAVIALGVWCFVVLMNWGHDLKGQHLFLLQIFVLLAATINLAGTAMLDHHRLGALSAAVRRPALVGALLAALGFLSVGIHGLPSWMWGNYDDVGGDWVRKGAATGWQVALIIAFGLETFGLALYSYRKAAAGTRSWHNSAGLALAVVAVLLMLITPFQPGRYGDVVFMYVAINGTVFAALIWLIAHGYRTADRFQVYCGFIFFGIELFTIYFISYWPLMSRSLLIMTGGAVLIAGVYILERQRRGTMAAEGGAS
ncbi:MAG: DUF2157 domain-containing protein [Pseudomonadota bacterium]